ncbi:60S ribosomal export protein NMD3-like [Silene latifolia]|uniref:60S ribosomal export protein NMD3-like n=1 Tax=Silene latifolia TaxID=37657 RepID=UPI003D784B41
MTNNNLLRQLGHKRNPDLGAHNRQKELQEISSIRQLKRILKISRKRTVFSYAEFVDNQLGVDQEADCNQVGGFLTRNQTIGNILCCKCGSPTPPNKANMCRFCLRVECNIAGALPSRVNIIYCPDCGKYLQPPKTWLKAERDSKELLTFCLKRLTKLSEFRLVDARFLPTEPNSKRIQVRLSVQSEILDQVYAENSHDVEYVVRYQKCPTCMPTDPDQWVAVVQVRQHVSHMRTFLSLEQLLIKHNAAQYAVKIKPVKEGIDFYFGTRSDAAKFYFILARLTPIKPQKFQKKLKSQDTKSNISLYEFAICATICPICHDDLVYLPSKLSARLGHLGPLVICTKVSNNISLLDPFTLQTYTMSAEMYWREPFEPLLSYKQLVEYIVLDVEVVSSEVESRWLGGYTEADVQIARVSDFGKNDRISSVRTHLGHILKPGDYALGYDLCGANFNNSEAEERSGSFPDAVLIKKTYREQGQASTKNSFQEKEDSEYERFKKDLFVNPELRFNLSLDEKEERDCSKMESSVASDLDQITSGQLEDIFAELGLSDDEHGSVADRTT